MPFLFKYLAERPVSLDFGLVFVIASCIYHTSDLQNCHLLWADHGLKQASSLLSLCCFMTDNFVGKIACSEAHHHDVWFYLRCSETK